MEYVQMTINDWLEIKHKLKMELQGVKQSFVRIGYALRKIDDQRLYENDGYKSIAEFAKEEYGLEASTVSRFMSINREYSIDGYSEHLREEYLEMGRSQLEEMLKLPNKDREMIQPEASREQIRELKRFNKSEPAAGVADDVVKLIEKFYEDNPDVLNGVLDENVLERKIEVVNPSGNRSYKKGMFFLMMYEDNIKIKKFGAEPQTMSWSEFFDITETISENVAAGENNTVTVEVVPDVPVEITDLNKATEAAMLDAKKAEIEAVPGHTEEEIEVIPMGTASLKDIVTGNVTKPTKQEIEEAEKEYKESMKKEIAPAQKSPEILEKTEPESAIGKTVESIEKAAFEQAMNPPEIVEKSFGTRKDYIDSLTEYGAAIYIAEEYERHSLKVTSLAYPTELEKWLLEEVDVNGYSMREA